MPPRRLAAVLLALALPACASAGGDDAADAGGGGRIDASGGGGIDAAPCAADGNEPNDAVGAATVPDYGVPGLVRYQDLSICGGDEDHFYAYLFSGEVLEVEATFAQASAAEDLDILLYAGNCEGDFGEGACTSADLLTPCTDEDPSGCDAANGQSRDADERLTFTAPATQAYLFVVRGFQGGAGVYDLCTSVGPETCF